MNSSSTGTNQTGQGLLQCLTRVNYTSMSVSARRYALPLLVSVHAYQTYSTLLKNTASLLTLCPIFGQIQIPLIVENGWCVYEVDFGNKSKIVMDPMETSTGPRRMVKKHAQMKHLILHSLCQCLHEWYPDWHFATFPWTYRYNYGMHRSCSDRYTSSSKLIVSILIELTDKVALNTVDITIHNWPIHNLCHCNDETGFYALHYIREHTGIMLKTPVTTVS